ncbi:MAG: hypothetical protein ABIS23_00865 [Sphingomicrobium sp.]
MQQSTQKVSDTAELKLTYKDSKWRMAKGMENAKGKGEYPVLEVKKDHVGKFTFKINDQDNVTFADVPFAPMAGANNPTDFAGQFTVKKESPKKIVVDVLNATPGDPEAEYLGGTYTYELRFDGATTLDPIITNGGCCRTTMQSDMAFLAVGAVALLALIFLVVRPMLARRAAG